MISDDADQVGALGFSPIMQDVSAAAASAWFTTLKCPSYWSDITDNYSPNSIIKFTAGLYWTVLQTGDEM